MPFTKDAQSKGGKNMHIKRQEWDNIVYYLNTEGAQGFLEIMLKLRFGDKVNRYQQKYLKYYMDLLEYHKPKLSKVESQQTINVKMSLTDYLSQIPSKVIESEIVNNETRLVESETQAQKDNKSILDIVCNPDFPINKYGKALESRNKE